MTPSEPAPAVNRLRPAPGAPARSTAKGDVFGLVGDAPLSVTRQVDEDAIRYGLQGLQLVDKRSQLLSLDAMRQDASDEYALVRNAWMQRRTFQIEGDRRRREQSDGLPDYLEEEDPYPTVPADAMPVPIPGG